MIYLLCRAAISIYFIEYTNSIENSSEIKVVIYDKFTDVKIMDNNYYIFILGPDLRNHIGYLKERPNIAIFNGEQLTRNIWADVYQELINNKLPIFDYDLYQIKRMNNKVTRYLPYQITEVETNVLENLVQNTSKTYDVAFCGTNSKRRGKIISDLSNKGLSIINVREWGLKRDEMIVQAKILINIHFGADYNIYEHFRCDRWLLSGQMVISETGLSDDMLDIKDLVLFEDYDKIVDYTINIINNYDAYYSTYRDKLNKIKDAVKTERGQYLKDCVEQIQNGLNLRECKQTRCRN